MRTHRGREPQKKVWDDTSAVEGGVEARGLRHCQIRQRDGAVPKTGHLGASKETSIAPESPVARLKQNPVDLIQDIDGVQRKIGSR